jgi:hypothetical protein
MACQHFALDVLKIESWPHDGCQHKSSATALFPCREEVEEIIFVVGKNKNLMKRIGE